ncbi:MAG: septum formation inhibitor Maf [Acidobacteria bacterium]|nr:MAG: septum formation inhibitor Maf [Acidobacteriota bacterium]
MLILASQSPRRAELLRNAGLSFELRPAEIDETPCEGEDPFEYVKRLAREKALEVLESAPDGAVVIGADTTVVVDGECLGKPLDEADARRMLSLLSGRTHQVMTGVCVARRDPDGNALVEVGAEVTEVSFAEMTPEEITAYVASGEPMDKAGAYAIQGQASRWIPRIQGCYFNVVGLPVARVCAMLARARREVLI